MPRTLQVAPPAFVRQIVAKTATIARRNLDGRGCAGVASTPPTPGGARAHPAGPQGGLHRDGRGDRHDRVLDRLRDHLPGQLLRLRAGHARAPRSAPRRVPRSDLGDRSAPDRRRIGHEATAPCGGQTAPWPPGAEAADDLVDHEAGGDRTADARRWCRCRWRRRAPPAASGPTVWPRRAAPTHTATTAPRCSGGGGAGDDVLQGRDEDALAEPVERARPATSTGSDGATPMSDEGDGEEDAGGGEQPRRPRSRPAARPEAQRGDGRRDGGDGDHQAPLAGASPNSRSRCTGIAVRKRPKISMKTTKPMMIEPTTSRWRTAAAGRPAAARAA